MGAQEDQAKRKEFQKRTDEDIDSFLARSEFSKSGQKPQALTSAQPTQTAQKPTERSPPQEENKEAPEEDNDEQIKMARASRAQAEAYHDVAVYRKRAHSYSHKAGKFYHKYKANEAKAQKCQAKAVTFREKSAVKRKRALEHLGKVKEYEAELSAAAQGKGDFSPESVRSKMATFERKAAKEEEIARKNDHKAADLTEKAAKFRSRAARFLEQNKLFENESRLFSRRADNLEKAGP